MQKTDNQHHQKPLNFAVRFSIICALLTLLFLSTGNPLLHLLTPIFEWEISQLAPYFKIVQFAVINNLDSDVFLLKISISEMIVVGGQFVFPNEAGTASASTVVSYIWQVSVLYGALLYAWPLKNKHEAWMRTLLALPMLLMTLMLDTPLALLGAIWGIIYQTYPSEQTSLLIDWNHFMMAGGRLMLGLVAAMLTLHLSKLLNNKRSKG